MSLLNPDFAIFDDNMFVQLRAAIDHMTPPDDLDVINLTIGEPQLPAPKLLTDTIAQHDDKWHSYPKADGDPEFRGDVHHYITKRYGDNVADIIDPDRHIVPVVGTREPLHLLGQMVRGAKDDAAALIPNPFYHAWRAGALGAGGDIIMLNVTATKPCRIRAFRQGIQDNQIIKPFAKLSSHFKSANGRCITPNIGIAFI